MDFFSIMKKLVNAVLKDAPAQRTVEMPVAPATSPQKQPKAIPETQAEESPWKRAQRERKSRTFTGKEYRGEAVYTIPSQYEIVGARALADCRSLEVLVVPGTVREIEREAFQGCSNLRQVRMEEGVAQLNNNLFQGCTALQRITLPDSVDFIRVSTFKGLETLLMPVMNDSGTVLYHYPKNLTEKCVRLPEGIRVIEEYAFQECKAMEEILLPETVEWIKWGAFEGTNLHSITLPPRLKCVKHYAFNHCRRLEKLDILCEYSAIESNAFSGCSSIRWNLGPPQVQMELLRILGERLFSPPKNNDDYWKLELPTSSHENDPRFLELAEGCLMGEQEAMEQMADYFRSKQILGHPFYEVAENFWRVRLYFLGNENAKQWLYQWMEEHSGMRIRVAANVPVPNGDGKILNALGFLFFDPERSYDVNLYGKSGQMEVTAFADEDGPDEDGFGRETYYDWWYMTENLAMVPNAGWIHSYSNLDKRNNLERFSTIQEYVEETWKNHSELVRQGIREEIQRRRNSGLK